MCRLVAPRLAGPADEGPPPQVTTDVLVVGGGLSGLAAAWQLHRSGVEVLLLEARPRLGGRILTAESGGAHFDLGPSWVWHGQPYVARLLTHFDLSTYDQYCDGILLHQDADGRIRKDPFLSPMENAQRIEGGAGALIEALAADVPPERIRLDARAFAFGFEGNRITVTASERDGEKTYHADRVALALSPRLAAALRFEPLLDETTLRSLAAIPTWMAAHAKFFALYREPFWRRNGLSGDALSSRGPLAEIHDASPRESGPYALFGFVGLDAKTRTAMGPAALIRAATAQLVDLFGPEAEETTDVYLKDWSAEEFTAVSADRKPLSSHPSYGWEPRLEAPWAGRLHFIGTETAVQNGGLIEGALEQAMSFVRATTESGSGSSSGASEPRAASMSWDWIRR